MPFIVALYGRSFICTIATDDKPWLWNGKDCKWYNFCLPITLFSKFLLTNKIQWVTASKPFWRTSEMALTISQVNMQGITLFNRYMYIILISVLNYHQPNIKRHQIPSFVHEIYISGGLLYLRNDDSNFQQEKLAVQRENSPMLPQADYFSVKKTRKTLTVDHYVLKNMTFHIRY